MNQDMIVDHFYNIAYLNNVPVSVVIELSTRCNLRCEHCYLPNYHQSGMNTEKMRSLLTELRELGVVNVSFTGGEILLREDLFELIKIARNLHLRVFLLSNGTLLNQNKVERLAKLYISEFSTTMFSTQCEIHDSITTSKGSLDRLKQNLQMLKENNIRVQIKMPIMEFNSLCVDEVREYCEVNNFKFFASPMIYSKLDGNESPKCLRVHDNKLGTVVKKIDEMNNRKNKLIHETEVPCGALFYSFSIDSEGNVFPCNAFPYKVGSVFENTISDIWNHSESLKYIKSIKKSDLKHCPSCEFQSECERCPGMALLDKGDIFECDTFARSIAKLRVRNYCSNEM
ncbi:radical SAM/SPASM domain-containing protein [Paenibacillus senegalimassiliensis]|uniref:radical SAM/SPASM domain-containing protein n=1 Tax=Paenibacillus senegalimassiliensis TaxID=1737426 RepID=UPI00073E9875|nr:radical SAM protein [Paenibacillus senegalimassiliensis]